MSGGDGDRRRSERDTGHHQEQRQIGAEEGRRNGLRQRAAVAHQRSQPSEPTGYELDQQQPDRGGSQP